MMILAWLLLLLVDSSFGVTEAELVQARQLFNALNTQDYSYEYKQGLHTKFTDQPLRTLLLCGGSLQIKVSNCEACNGAGYCFGGKWPAF